MRKREVFLEGMLCHGLTLDWCNKEAIVSSDIEVLLSGIYQRLLLCDFSLLKIRRTLIVAKDNGCMCV